MAMHINLRDWRQARRERRKLQFLVMLGLGAAASIVIVLLSWAAAAAALQHQNARNDYLKQQIAEADKKIKEIEDLEKTKQSLLSRMRVIEQLQASRSATVHFFDEIVNTLPDGVTLTGIKQSGDGVALTGLAESNGRISTYMKNLEASPWFADPRLVVIKTGEKDNQRQSEFTLQVKNLTKATDKTRAKEKEKGEDAP